MGQAISEHPLVRKVAFTGSTFTGRKIQEASARTNLKDVTLELGGKSPTVIFDDADLDQAVKWASRGILCDSSLSFLFLRLSAIFPASTWVGSCLSLCQWAFSYQNDSSDHQVKSALQVHAYFFRKESTTPSWRDLRRRLRSCKALQVIHLRRPHSTVLKYPKRNSM